MEKPWRKKPVNDLSHTLSHTLNYTLPDFTVYLRMNLFFAQLQRESPDVFVDGVRLTSVYGCFPNCIANGGRAYVGERATPDQMHATFSALNDAGLTARLTFTNMYVDEDVLSDPYVCSILDAAESHDVEVILYSDAMDAFLQENHRFKRILSTTREISDIDTLNAALERFDYVVLNYNLNKDYEFLSQVARPERLEVMVNELCTPGCPFRQQHYEHNSQDQRNGTNTPFRGCDLSGVDYRHSESSPTIYTTGELARLRADFGIRYFKIVGRGVGSQMVVDAYLYYLIKPAYHAAVRRMLGV